MLCAIALLVLVTSGAGLGAAKTYLDNVEDSLAAIEAGRTQDSVASLRQALACNANDPLAHTALGLTLLIGGRAGEAKSEFSLAVELDPDCAEAVYGLGLVALGKPDLSEAARLFCLAEQTRSGLGVEGSIGYVKALAGGVFEPSGEGADDEALQALRAMALMKTQKWPEALTVWKDLQLKAARIGFGERLGCSMTFVRSAPLALAGWPLDKPYRPIVAVRNNMPKLAGNVNLKADLSRASDVRMVSFFVDGRFVGMTNTPPFNYIWDTTGTPNGVHVVKIQGSGTGGDVVSVKSTNVLVANKGTGLPSARATGASADAAWGLLWKCMCLKPSAAAINYNLALCAERLGDPAGAKAALERALAADPRYEDAAARLSKIYAPSGQFTRLYKGDAGRKVIALTFDDGPKKDSARILDILKAKGVKATFFLVGKQANTYPDTVKRIANDGHEIGCHTYNHRDLEYLTENEITQEVFQTVATVRALTGRDTHYLRPPGGHEGKQLPGVLRRFGITCVYWSSNCSKTEGTTRKKLFNYAVSTARPGGIILLHNLELVTLQALPDIIDALRSKGYGFVTLSELK